MDAVVLSGGLGTRLRPLTYTRPKPLLPVANRPMLEHLLDRLPETVDRAILAAGYRVEQIRDWLDELDDRVELVVVDEETPLGTGGAVKHLEDHLRGPFLCFNGDVLSTAPLETLVERRREADALGALALCEVDEPRHYGVVDREGDRIRRFVEKPDPGEAPSSLINAGTYCFDAELLDLVEPDREVSLEREVFPRAADSERGLLGIPFDGYWVDCGRPPAYLRAHDLVLDEGATLAEGAHVDGGVERWACLGPDAVAEAGTHLRRAVLYRDATVKAGARVEDTVLGEGVTVGKDATLAGCVVADSETVDAGATHEAASLGVDPDRPVGGK